MTARAWVLPTAVAAVGTAATASAAVAGRLPAGDAVTLVIYAAGAAAIAAVVAVAVLSGLRRRSIVLQTAVAALAPLVAVAIGVVAAASAMFISSHDLHALIVVLVAAGTVGVLSGLILGRRVATAGRSLGAMARGLGDEEVGEVSGGHDAPSELASLATELEATSARLTEARAQSAAIEHSRRQLVAWVSHDLRTPLAGIRAMVEALEDGVVDEPETVARYYRTMRREVDRLSGLVDDLFELSRIEAGALGLDFERVPLDELVSEAVASASVIAGAKGIDLRGAVGEPSPVVELSRPSWVTRGQTPSCPSGTRAAASPRRISTTSSSWPTGATPPARREAQGPDSAWPSPGDWWKPTKAASPCATKATAAGSPCACLYRALRRRTHEGPRHRWRRLHRFPCGRRPLRRRRAGASSRPGTHAANRRARRVRRGRHP
jgi:signal transduction histidine kinase